MVVEAVDSTLVEVVRLSARLMMETLNYFLLLEVGLGVLRYLRRRPSHLRRWCTVRGCWPSLELLSSLRWLIDLQVRYLAP